MKENTLQKTEKPNYWKLLLHYLDEFETGSFVNRQDIFAKFEELNPLILKMSTDVIDKYRRWLTAAKFLSETKVKGKYKIIKKIDIYLSSSDCERLGYPERFKRLDKEKAKQQKLKLKNKSK